MSFPSTSNSVASSAALIAESSQSKLLNVLVVDDTNLFRHIMNTALSSLSQVNVVGTISNGPDCLALLETQSANIDVIFLDVEMPVMNGLETLRVIRQRYPKILVIMVTGHNKSNMEITIEALSLGAYDFIGKPEGASGAESQEQLRKQLFVLTRSISWQRSQEKLRMRQQALGKVKSSKVSALSADFPVNTVLDGALPLANKLTEKLETFDVAVVQPATTTANTTAKPVVAPTATASVKQAQSLAKKATPTPKAQPVQPQSSNNSASQAVVIEGKKNQPNTGNTSQTAKTPSARKATRLEVAPKVLLIGISTGGPAALMQLLPKLPATLGIPVLVVQHMPPNFTKSLATSLNKSANLLIKEAEHEEMLKPNVVYLAPGGYHMEVGLNAGGNPMVVLNQNPPVNSCRPSADVLFKSIPAVFKNKTLSLIMTGMGRDGCEGIRYLKQTTGTYCVTQSEDTCVVYGMPKAIDDEHLNDESVGLSGLAQRVCELLGKPLS